MKTDICINGWHRLNPKSCKLRPSTKNKSSILSFWTSRKTSLRRRWKRWSIIWRKRTSRLWTKLMICRRNWSRLIFKGKWRKNNSTSWSFRWVKTKSPWARVFSTACKAREALWSKTWTKTWAQCVATTPSWANNWASTWTEPTSKTNSDHCPKTTTSDSANSSNKTTSWNNS